MAKLGVSIDCFLHGKTLVQISFNGQRAGATDDQLSVRVLRRQAGETDFVLTGVMNVLLTALPNSFMFQWLDADVPIAGATDYVAQLKPITGTGTLGEVTLTAQHMKR